MVTLNKNWLTENHIDFEYKKYVLLAYLQDVGNHFETNRLYPCLGELIDHYRLIMSFRNTQKSLRDSFPHRMQNIDLKSFKIKYENIIQDDKIMEEIESIIDFSIPQFEHCLTEGKKIYDFIEEQLRIYPIGVLPLNAEHGYLFLSDTNSSTTGVYGYQVSIFEQPDVKYRGIHTQFIKEYKRTIIRTFENLKTELIRENKGMPNPAVFVVESEMKLPLSETFLPIAKRILVRTIANTN